MTEIFGQEMPFGSVFRIFKYVSITSVERQSYIPAFTSSDNVQTSFENNLVTKLGFRTLGIPHIGLRLRAKKIIKNVPSQATKMLDAGFGTGVYSFTLANKITAIDAIDIDIQKIDYVSKINPFKNIRFQRMDLTNLAFEDSIFDLIVCSEVLEYIENYQSAFSELARVLKKGGVLLLTVPYDPDRQHAIDNGYYGHVHTGYTEKDIQDLCIKNGLTMVRNEGYSYYLAEKVSKINYNIADKKIILGVSFYLLYGVAQLGELFFSRSRPHGMFFKIIKK
jgi:ubiquinone/menaquinone biosynthesis C-methylase UbiE